MAICSGAAVPALEDECAGGGHQPTCSQLATARTPARHRTPRLAVLGVCPRPGRSHGAVGRGGTPRSPCSPLPPHVAGTGAGEELWLQDLLVAVSAGRDPSIQTRESAPTLAPAASAPDPGWRAECAWPRALLELPRRSRRRGVRRAHRTTLRPREARLGASPSKGKATPRAEPRRSFPAASPLKEARANSRYVLGEGCGAGAVPYVTLIRT